jgi:5-formyltetrahydrofolate cyclo-ligase
MARSAPRHDRDAGGPADVLAAKAALRQEVWSAMRAAGVARFPGAAGRIPNFTGAEAAAERLRATPAWRAARTVKANPDSAQWPVRQRALEDGKTVYMAVPRLAGPEPFFALDPDHLSEPPRKAASISGAARSARRVTLAELSPVDLVVMGCVAAGEDGSRLGKGGGFADLEFALAAAAGLIGPDTVSVTTVHELQLRGPGSGKPGLRTHAGPGAGTGTGSVQEERLGWRQAVRIRSMAGRTWSRAASRGRPDMSSES